MNDLILHPSRNFLDARNPSSQFQYRLQMANIVWSYIYERATVFYTMFNCGWHLRIGNSYFKAGNLKELFSKIMSSYMLTAK